jgi:hypothetical protein
MNYFQSILLDFMTGKKAATLKTNTFYRIKFLASPEMKKRWAGFLGAPIFLIMCPPSDLPIDGIGRGAHPK